MLHGKVVQCLCCNITVSEHFLMNTRVKFGGYQVTSVGISFEKKLRKRLFSNVCAHCNQQGTLPTKIKELIIYVLSFTMYN